jgi:predicted PurR-regulated permease PerM
VIRYVDRAGMRMSAEYYPVLRRLLPLSVRGTALGLCSVALLEGVVLGIAYMVAGAPAPALLGVVTGYLALIPGGAPLSFTVVSLFLLGSGNPGPALGLFCWGCFELFLVDKFVRPKLIGHRVDLPFLAVLFGLLGGVSTIGVLGLFVGPFLMAVLFWWLRGGKVEAVVETRKDEVAM